MEYKFKLNNKKYKIRNHSIADWLCTLVLFVIACGATTAMLLIPSVIEWLVKFI